MNSSDTTWTLAYALTNNCASSHYLTVHGLFSYYINPLSFNDNECSRILFFNDNANSQIDIMNASDTTWTFAYKPTNNRFKSIFSLCMDCFL